VGALLSDDLHASLFHQRHDGTLSLAFLASFPFLTSDDHWFDPLLLDTQIIIPGATDLARAGILTPSPREGARPQGVKCAFDDVDECRRFPARDRTRFDVCELSMTARDHAPPRTGQATTIHWCTDSKPFKGVEDLARRDRLQSQESAGSPLCAFDDGLECWQPDPRPRLIPVLVRLITVQGVQRVVQPGGRCLGAHEVKSMNALPES
jgi:hypothetical protein